MRNQHRSNSYTSYLTSFAKTAAFFAAGWLGLQWFGDAVSAEVAGLQEVASEGFTRRHLLQSNPQYLQLPQQQVDPNTIYHYTFDPEALFEVANITSVNATSNDGSPLPSWILFGPEISSLGSIDAPSSVDVVVEGDLAYVAEYNNGLSIYNISDPTCTTLVGNNATSISAWSIAVENNMAYVVYYYDGLRIYDVSDPSYPEFKGFYEITPGVTDGLDVADNYAYLASSFLGLVIVDVSDASNPNYVSEYKPTPTSRIQGVTVRGSRAYLVGIDTVSHFYIVDVSNPLAPNPIGSYPGNPANLGANRVDVLNNLVVFTHLNTGFDILDISNPSSPALFSTTDVSGRAWDVKIKNNLLYLTDTFDGLHIYDISSPISPKLLGSYDTPTNAQGLAIKNETIYVADGAAVEIINFFADFRQLRGVAPSDPAKYSLNITAITNTMDCVTASYTLLIDNLPFNKNLILDQLAIVNVPFSLIIDTDVYFRDLDDDWLFMQSEKTSGLPIPNWLSFKGIAPQLVGAAETPANAWDVAVSPDERYAFVAADVSGLVIFDISVPDNPVLISNVASSDKSDGVAYRDNKVYFCDGLGGFKIYDVKDPSTNTPSLLDTHNPVDVDFEYVILRNNLAYVSSNADGFYIIDISNPNALVEIDNYLPTPVGPNGWQFIKNFDVVGNTAYLACLFRGIKVLDISVPTSITLLGTYSLPSGHVRDIVVKNNYAYMGGRGKDNGLMILDVSDPANMFMVASLPLGGLTREIILNNNILYITDENKGLYLIDVRDPKNPSVLTNYDTEGVAHGSALYKGKIYIADGYGINGGLKIIDGFNRYELSGTPAVTDADTFAIDVNACDFLGACTTASFEMHIEGPPVYNGIPIPNQSFATGLPLTYFIPDNVFSDPNGDILSYSVKRDEILDIPSWMLFSSAGVFSGIPSVNDAGTYNLTITARDGNGGAASTFFLMSINNFPSVSKPIPQPNPVKGASSFTFVVPADTFVDADGNPMTYTAALADGTALPGWMQFDPLTLTFTGNPTEGDQGAWVVRVVATDAVNGGSTSATFTLQVNPNFKPVLTNPLAAQSANVNERFQFTVPLNTFSDQNNDVLTYSASGLPKWLAFDPSSRTFIGEPSRSDTGTYKDGITEVLVAANDGQATATANLRINVSGESHLELAIKIGSPLLAAVSVMIGLYAKRSVIINRCKKSRYLKANQEAKVGDSFRYGFFTPVKQNAKLSVKQYKNAEDYGWYQPKWLVSSRKKLPGGVALPSWLQFDTAANELISETGPGEKDCGVYVVQVKDKHGITKEQFDLEVVDQMGMRALGASAEGTTSIEMGILSGSPLDDGSGTMASQDNPIFDEALKAEPASQGWMQIWQEARREDQERIRLLEEKLDNFEMAV